MQLQLAGHAHEQNAQKKQSYLIAKAMKWAKGNGEGMHEMLAFCCMHDSQSCKSWSWLMLVNITMPTSIIPGHAQTCTNCHSYEYRHCTIAM